MVRPVLFESRSRPAISMVVAVATVLAATIRRGMPAPSPPDSGPSTAATHRMFVPSVGGGSGWMEEADLAGMERCVVQSGAAGVGPSYGGLEASEDGGRADAGTSAYHHSKRQRGRAALAAQVPVALVLTTAPTG